MSQLSREDAERAIRAYLNGDDSPEGKRLFEQWYASFPDEERSELRPDSATADRLWQRIARQTDKPVPDESETRVVALPVYRRSGWVAAALVVLLSIGTTVWYLINRTVTSASTVVYAERVNAPGQRSVVRLPDGSVVHLNAASRLRFPESFAPNRREVWLTGEAFFEVRRHPDQPFVVRTGALQTTVLGTSFDVRAYPNESRVEVAVVTGKVQVANATSWVLLTPNRMATYQTAQRTLTTRTLRDAQEQAVWMNGRLVFEKQKLTDIIAVLERHYNVTITLKDKRLANYTLNADFDNEPLTQVLDLLCGYLKTNYKRSGHDIVIGR